MLCITSAFSRLGHREFLLQEHRGPWLEENEAPRASCRCPHCNSARQKCCLKTHSLCLQFNQSWRDKIYWQDFQENTFHSCALLGYISQWHRVKSYKLYNLWGWMLFCQGQQQQPKSSREQEDDPCCLHRARVSPEQPISSTRNGICVMCNHVPDSLNLRFIVLQPLRCAYC